MMRGSAPTSNASTSGTEVIVWGAVRYLTGGWYVKDDNLYIGVTNGHHDAHEDFYTADYIYEINRC